MLYLNALNFILSPLFKYLTLTSVVFEFWLIETLDVRAFNLTLTSVVFEFRYRYCVYSERFYLTLTSVLFEFSSTFSHFFFYIFNFNKCCIWIGIGKSALVAWINLTLTSVVFEFIFIH